MNNNITKTILKQFENPELVFAYIDLFCGAGGTSTGVNNSRYGRVIACVNHDPTAIASHAANHPNAIHFIEDIRTLSLTGIVKLVQQIRAMYPHVKIVLWASLECTNFSKAKGGLPREADSRTLAEHLYRYIETIDPDYIQIENVVEFMSWGPLDDNGKPISRKNGWDWMRWRHHVKSYGYQDGWRQLNAADFGAYTSRNRLFGIFAKHGLPIAWPEPTHAKRPTVNMFGMPLKKWMPVRDCLDFSDEGVSIFGRKKPLVEKTLERIYAGLVKFIANGDDRFITKYFSGKPAQKCISVDGPAGTVTTVDGQALVSASFLMKYNSSNPVTGQVSAGIDLNEPCHTLAVQQRIAVVHPEFLLKYNNQENGVSLDNPSPVLTTKDKMGLIMMKYHGNGGQLVNPDEPCSTLTTKDRVATVFLDQQYGASKPADIDEPAATLTANPKLAMAFIDRNFTSGGGKHVDINGPMGALMTVPKANLVSCEKWVMDTNFDNVGVSLEDPLSTITANRKWHYLVNPQYASKGGNVDEPAFTLIARMDKMPPYLVSTETGEAVIIIYPDDSEIMQKIKIFMAVYGIIDIKMRMLKIPELKLIQGFPASYILTGTQTEQKKHIGNSVESHVPTAMIDALAPYFIKNQIEAD